MNPFTVSVGVELLFCCRLTMEIPAFMINQRWPWERERERGRVIKWEIGSHILMIYTDFVSIKANVNHPTHQLPHFLIWFYITSKTQCLFIYFCLLSLHIYWSKKSLIGTQSDLTRPKSSLHYHSNENELHSI